ncbi:hypothetical protein G9A89_012053 [Geosiphon pyriformis]|nr:hypothetical protein G9A89_012053 [Geosiphon pyriformis]
MQPIEFLELFGMVFDLPIGKTAGLSGISNELEAWVSIIPKPYEWETLIEMACKILSKILFDRILLACSTHNVLYGNNFLVLKGMTTQTPIFTIGSVVEDALEKDWELWLVLQDMQKAYNSVE